MVGLTPSLGHFAFFILTILLVRPLQAALLLH
jgi:hypothetical protein